MKRYVILILLMGLLIGCETNNETSNSNETVISEAVLKYLAFDEYLEVGSSIDYYHLTMSSVPGLPLDFKVLKDEAEYTIEISVSAGKLLSWKDSIVEPLGDTVFMEYKDFTIYWSPLDDVIIENADLLIEVKQDDDTIAKAAYQMALSDKGYVLMQIVLTDE